MKKHDNENNGFQEFLGALGLTENPILGIVSHMVEAVDLTQAAAPVAEGLIDAVTLGDPTFFFDSINEGLEAVGDAALDALDEKLNSIGSSFEAAGDSVIDAIGTAGDWVWDRFDDVADFFDSFFL